VGCDRHLSRIQALFRRCQGRLPVNNRIWRRNGAITGALCAKAPCSQADYFQSSLIRVTLLAQSRVTSDIHYFSLCCVQHSQHLLASV
jgi:hypothetical protein